MNRRDYRGKSCSRFDAPVHIRYYAVPNANKTSGGYMPVYRTGFHKAREYGHTFGRGRSRTQALRDAKAMALQHARKHRGDWCVTVKEGTSRTHRRDGSSRSRPR